MLTSKRMDLVENEDFLLQLEYNKDFFILHLPRIKATAGAVKHLMAKLEELEEFATTVGFEGIFAAIPQEDQSMAKLLRIIKAKKLGHNQGLDVYLIRGSV